MSKWTAAKLLLVRYHLECMIFDTFHLLSSQISPNNSEFSTSQRARYKHTYRLKMCPLASGEEQHHCASMLVVTQTRLLLQLARRVQAAVSYKFVSNSPRVFLTLIIYQTAGSTTRICAANLQQLMQRLHLAVSTF